MVIGTLDLPSIEYVELGIVFDGNTKTGILDLPPVGDVDNGVVFANNRHTGALYLPSINHVYSGITYGSYNTEFTGIYSGGTSACDYPSVLDVRSGITFDYGSSTGLLELPAIGNVRYNIKYGAASEYTGTLILPSAVNVLHGIGYGEEGLEYIGTYAGSTVNGAADLITSAFKELYIMAINQLLEDDALTVPCKLIYGDTKWKECPNCIFNVSTGKSSGKYKHGGPIYFKQGVCQFCNGLGRLPITSEEELYLAAIFDSKDWIKWNKDTLSPYTPDMFVQTISKFIETYTKLKRTKHIIIDTNIRDYTTRMYERYGEPEPVGLGVSTYVITMWKRI